MLRTRFRWLLLIAGLFLVPGTLFAQMPPPVSFTGPLSHTPYDSPGLYTYADMIYWRTNQPLQTQPIAFRGFLDVNGSLVPSGVPGTYFGSKDETLNTEALLGSNTYQPGWDLGIGWRFQSGVSVELGWRHLVQARYTATAALIQPNFDVGNFLENTFLFSPVVNFPGQWNGNAQNFLQGTPGATAGIWNAATFMQIDFTQRFDTYELKVRVPYLQQDSYRSYGLFGPRITWIWDRFGWRTIDTDPFGSGSGATSAMYTNTISNRMYGIHFGGGNDWFLGNTPIGGFAFTCEVEGSISLDLAKTRGGSYALLDGTISSTRSRRMNAIVPGVEGRMALWWYPWEGISMQLGYDVMTFFNTISSHQPVDFNLGTVDPEYQRDFRWFYGIRAGITFVW